MSAGIRAGASNDGYLHINGADAIKFDANGIERVAFSAHNNNVVQNIPNLAWTQLNMSTEAFDHGGFFASNAWTPPAGRPIMLCMGVELSTAFAGAEVISAIYKNGLLFKQGSRAGSAGSADTQSVVTAIDVPNGTDVYTARVFQSSGGAKNTLGDAGVTYFQGVRL